MLGATVYAGGRLALRASSSRAFARASLQPWDRLAAFQGPSDPLHVRQGFLNARNYRWSKSATSEVANTSPHAPEPVTQAKTETPRAAPEDAVALADIPSEQVGSIDSTTGSVPTIESLSQVPPVDVSAPGSGVIDVVTSAIPPLQYGDFAALGITSWWPSGIITWTFELLQVTTGMPWFYTIIAGTLFWRVILIPSALTGVRSAARLRPYAEQMKALDEQAQGVKDRTAQMEFMLKKQKLIEKAGVTVGSMTLSPLIQVVGNFGLFFAVKGMTQLPVIQLAQSGVWFLPDLTLTGDYVMPMLVLLAMNVQLSLSKRELDPTKPVMAHVMNVMRVASFASLPMMSWMPAGMWLSVLTGVSLAITQSALLRVPRIRQALTIPPATPMPPVTMKDTGRAILEWYNRKRMEAAANQLAAHERKPNWTTLPKASRRGRG